MPRASVSTAGAASTRRNSDQAPLALAVALLQGMVAPTQRLTAAPAGSSPQILACLAPAALLWSLREHILLMKSADVTCADLWDLVTGYIAYLVGGGGTEPNLEGGAPFDRYLKELVAQTDALIL